MYRILIVEDEDVVRERLANLLDLPAMGITMVLQAKNSYEGIIAAKKFEPHIIVADIKMPGMNGISMMHEIYRFLPNIKCLFLSAYSDFAYAQSAIELGVNAYILKPFDEQDLYKKVYCLITEMNDEQMHSVTITPSYEANRLLVTSFIRELVCRNDDISAIIELLRIYGIEFRQRIYECFLIKVKDMSNLSESTFEQEVQQYFKKCMHSEEFYYIVIDEHHSKTLVLSGRNKEASSAPESVVHEFRDLLITKYSADMICGISKPSDTILGIREGFRQADIAMQFGFFTGESNITVYKETLFNFENANNIRSKVNFRLLAIKSQVIEQISFGQFSEAFKGIEQLLDVICRNKEMGMNAVISLYDNLSADIFAVAGRQYPNNLLPSEQKFRQELYNCINVMFIHQATYNVIDSIRVIPDNLITADREMHLVSQIRQIIHNEYKAGLSLGIIADRLLLSPSYAGSIFYKHTSKTFNSYLAEYRMECAKKLLIETSRSLVDISIDVGINDVTYFCTLFKKIVGISPGKYRQISLVDRLNNE